MTSVVTMTTGGASRVMTSSRGENLTSPVHSSTVTSTSALKTTSTATSVTDTTELGLGRRANSTTDTTTNSRSFTTAISQKSSSSLSFGSDNRSSPIYQTTSRASSSPPVYQTSPYSGSPTTTDRASSAFLTEYSLLSNRTSSPATEANRSQQTPTTTISEATTTRLSTVATSPPNGTITLTTAIDVTVTSLPPYTGNATLSYSSSDRQPANMTSRMTSGRPVTSEKMQIALNESSTADYTNTTAVHVSTADMITGAYYVDGMFVYASTHFLRFLHRARLVRDG